MIGLRVTVGLRYGRQSPLGGPEQHSPAREISLRRCTPAPLHPEVLATWSPLRPRKIPGAKDYEKAKKRLYIGEHDFKDFKRMTDVEDVELMVRSDTVRTGGGGV